MLTRSPRLMDHKFVLKSVHLSPLFGPSSAELFPLGRRVSVFVHDIGMGPARRAAAHNPNEWWESWGSGQTHRAQVSDFDLVKSLQLVCELLESLMFLLLCIASPQEASSPGYRSSTLDALKLTQHEEDYEKVLARPRPIINATSVLALVVRLQRGQVQVGRLFIICSLGVCLATGREHEARSALVGV